MMAPLYEFENVVQRYGEREVLSVPDLSIGERQIVGLAGHNGSGKSTLMRLLAFLERPTSGVIRFRGKERIAGENGVRREVTLLTQEPYLLKRSVAANVAYGLKVRGASNRREQVEKALDMVGLPPDIFYGRSWLELSGGEAQRVALAARLALEPRVLLMDEPTASLDEESAELIRDAALDARERWGTTLVVVSHDMTWLESISDTVVRFKQGRIVAA